MDQEQPEIELTTDTTGEQSIISRPRPQQPVQVVGEVGESPGQRPIFLHLDAVVTILASLPTGEPVEAGGLLIGYNCADAHGHYLLVEEAIPATLAQGRRLSLTFTHQAWEEMLARKQSEYPAQRIVGWYHTHPGLGVFLSGHDLFIHQHFFADSTHVALVIDPADFTWGLFYWQNSDLVAASGYFIYGREDNTYQTLTELLARYSAHWELRAPLD